MAYRIHEVETNCTYDDIYNTVDEAKAIVDEYIRDDQDDCRESTTYQIIDEDNNVVYEDDNG